MIIQNQGAIENIISKEKELINKYKDYIDVLNNNKARSVYEDIINKHNLHIEVLQKYIER